MHAYLLDLRVQDTCSLLLSTDRPIKQIALESGFRRPDAFRRALQERVGVALAVYLRIFAAE